MTEYFKSSECYHHFLGNSVKIKTFPLSSWIHVYTMYNDKHFKVFLTSLKSVVYKQSEK